jgi:ABC-type multidrug transport system fused ATPase/permease subunit
MKRDVKGEDNEDIKDEHHESVLEFVLHHQTTNAFLFSNVTPLKEIIKEKWNYYKHWLHGSFIVYLAFMVLLSISAVHRSHLKETVNKNDTAKYLNNVTKNVFVTFVSVLGLFFAAVTIVVVIIIKTFYANRFSSKTSTKFWRRLRMHLSLPYSNFMFRVYFCILIGLLMADFLFAALVAYEIVPDYENYCLIFAIIIGWYLVLFFLQTFKKISFYTVLVQRVITDMLKMACIMVIFLIAFSIAMYMIMQGADTDQDDFDDLGKTIVKMITIMLGIGDLDILFQARKPILAVLVFLLFVLLTTILLLNALIAMMSNTCTDLMSNQTGYSASKMHYRLQKLAMIVFLEGFFHDKLLKRVGDTKTVKRYDNEVKQYKMKDRSFWIQKIVKEELEADIEPSDEYLQHRDRTDILKNELIKTIKQGQSKLPKVKRSKIPKHKVSNTSAFPSELQTVQKRLDIKDYEQRQCERCMDERVTCLQSQEIQEVTEFI